MVQSNPDKMSQSYQEQEKKNKEAEEAVKHEEYLDRRVIFFAPASKHKVANFVKEKRQDGIIVTPESSLGFTENLFITDDPEKIKHIRESYSFVNGLVKECATLEEANGLRLNLQFNLKQERKIETTVEDTQRV